MKILANDYSKGEIMRIIREWTNLTQKEFAKAIGKSRSAVLDYEYERSNYTIDTLLQIAKEFDIKIIIEKNE